jgi:hypothetical protein
MLAGYTVNVTDVGRPPAGEPCYPDAVVEMWTHDINRFMDLDTAFATPEDRSIVMQDDASFIGVSLAWQVEELPAVGEQPRAELRTRTPGVKRISLHPAGSEPPAAPGVVCTVTHRVLSPLLPGRMGDSVPEPPPYTARLIVHEWAPSADSLPPVDVPTFLVGEYRQRVPA